MRPPGARSAVVLGLCIVAGAPGAPALALETDQYYAWDRELADATRVLNAKVNIEIADVLAEINRSRSWRSLSCDEVASRIAPRFKWFIFQDIEVWANNTPLLERAPATAQEERDYLQRYLYHVTGLFDPGTKVPPSPTIEIDGVRLGTDKLAHFFSQGWWYYKSYRRARQSGLDRTEAELRAIRNGIFAEKTVLGWTWGIFSSADLEANYQGLRFLAGLCEGDAPALERGARGWHHVRPFDIRDHVSPEWDESYQAALYGEQRWKRVRPVLEGYCPMLRDPRVTRRREAYALRDRETPTEREIRHLVAAGHLPAGESFTLEAVCAPAGPPAAAAR